MLLVTSCFSGAELALVTAVCPSAVFSVDASPFCGGAVVRTGAIFVISCLALRLATVSLLQLSEKQQVMLQRCDLQSEFALF